MQEFVQAAFSTVNVPYTVLLIMVVAYWSLVMIGLVGVDMFDFDLDLDVDMDADMDIEVGGGLGGGLMSWLGFLNIGEVPIMFYASLVVLGMWITSMQVNHWIGNENGWIAVALVVPNFVFSVLFVKLLLEPIKRLKKEQSHSSSLIGKVGVVKSLELTEKFGRCEIPTDTAPLIVNARTESGEVLQQGDPIVVVKHLAEEGFHIVTKHHWE